MSLVAAAHTARAGISVAAGQLAIVSRNVGNAADPEAHRKTAQVVGRTAGGATLVGVGRAESAALSAAVLAARSEAEAGRATSDALSAIENVTGVPGSANSASGAVARLGASLQLWGAAPADASAARATVSAARDVVIRINGAADGLTSARGEADRALAAAAAELRGALQTFSEQSEVIKRGSETSDISDVLDARDATLGHISELIGVRVVPRARGDLLLTTAGGMTLFETVPRAIDMETTPDLGSGRAGAPLHIDGEELGPPALSQIGGRIGALLDLRDRVIPVMQAQYDELARGLIAAFGERHVVGTGGADMPGLFDSPAISGVPPAGAATAGLAASIRVTPTVDPALGGRWQRIRDGGATGPDDPLYVANTSGAAGYASRLVGLAGAPDREQPIDAGLGFGAGLSVNGLARAISAELSQARGAAADRVEHGTQVMTRAVAAFTGEVGVNLDEELAHTLELERSYQASSRLLAAVDQMLGSLLAALA